MIELMRIFAPDMAERNAGKLRCDGVIHLHRNAASQMTRMLKTNNGSAVPI